MKYFDKRDAYILYQLALKHRAERLAKGYERLCQDYQSLEEVKEKVWKKARREFAPNVAKR